MAHIIPPPPPPLPLTADQQAYHDRALQALEAIQRERERSETSLRGRGEVPTMTPDIHRNLSPSRAEIVQCCHHANRQIIGGTPHGNLVVKLSDELVVKFGPGLSVEEADNQRRAFELLDSSIVRVPRVVRYFSCSRALSTLPMGYLVMEFISGDILKSVNSQQIDQLVKILSYFSTIQSQRPGPLEPGVSHGLLWEESGKPTFDTVKQMQDWLNIRLLKVETKLALEEYPLVLCHLDLAPRNIIWMKDGSVCLLDWCSAGFYPRFFEISLLNIMANSHGDYETTLRDRLEKLTDDEEAQMSLLEQSFYNGIRYYFPRCRDDTFSSKGRIEL